MSAYINVRGHVGKAAVETKNGGFCATLAHNELDRNNQPIEGIDPAWFVLFSTQNSKDLMSRLEAGDYIDVKGYMKVQQSENEAIMFDEQGNERAIKDKTLVVNVTKVSILSGSKSKDAQAGPQKDDIPFE